SLIGVIRSFKRMTAVTGNSNGSGYVAAVMARTFVLIFIVLFTASQFIYANSTIMGAGTSSPTSVFKQLSRMNEDKHNGKILTSEVSKLKIRCKAAHISVGSKNRYIDYKDKAKSTYGYWIVCKDGACLPLNRNDVNDINKKLLQSSEHGCTMTVNYYSCSKVVESYKIETNAKKSKSDNGELDDTDQSMVEIELGRDILERPVDMNCKNVYWEVKRNEKLVKYGPSDFGPGTLPASEYPFIVLTDEHEGDLISQAGDYAIRLIRVSGKDDEQKVEPASNTLEFTILDGSELDEKISVNVDEEVLKAELPKLPFDVSKVHNLYLYCDIEGEELEGFYESYGHMSMIKYTPGTVDLPDYTGDYTIYAGIQHIDGSYDMISPMMGFYHVHKSEYDLKVEKVNKMFDKVITAFEEEDVDTVANMLSHSVYIDLDDPQFSPQYYISNMIELYKGNIKGEPVEPRIEDYDLYGGHVYKCRWEFETTMGRYWLELDYCERSDDNNLNGVYDLDLGDLDTHDSVFVNDIFYRQNAFESMKK
ncbi:MAG: hypothetical protein IJ740_05415, partial [Ruminococcus sp.]|nr:hypothetical protein [Ruminococcus sp.]